MEKSSAAREAAVSVSVSVSAFVRENSGRKKKKKCEEQQLNCGASDLFKVSRDYEVESRLDNDSSWKTLAYGVRIIP